MKIKTYIFLLILLPLNVYLSLSLAGIIGFPFGIMLASFPLIHTIILTDFPKTNKKKENQK